MRTNVFFSSNLNPNLLSGLHKTGIRGIQDTRQIVDCKTNEILSDNKKVGQDFSK